jgi:CTP synthase (UTP-ammonia lyase)
MKIIKFDTTDTAGFDALQQKIHDHLTSKNGVNGFKYSATKWADSADAPANTDEGKMALVIECTSQNRYSLILDALTDAEKATIVDVDEDWVSIPDDEE